MRTDPAPLTKCLRGRVPPCAEACPFHLDVRDFIKKMKRGSYNAAYRVFRDTVVFPEIATALCGRGCVDTCPASLGGVDLPGLERACLRLASRRDPDRINMPPKAARIAVIGAGLNGLTCLLRLAKKKYDLTLYEKTERLGGSLWELLPEEAFLPEIQRQLQFEHYRSLLGHEVRDLRDIAAEGYDAIYVATGGTPPPLNLTGERQGGFLYDTNSGLLAAALDARGANAIVQGAEAARAIDRFLLIGGFFDPASAPEQQQEPAMAVSRQITVKTEAETYDGAKAMAEAGRCHGCVCSQCIQDCLLLQKSGKDPLQIKNDVMETADPGSYVVQQLLATRLIASCGDCGLCAQKCPEQINLGDFFMQARADMEEQNNLPWAFHEFYLRSLDFFQSPQAMLSRCPEGQSSCRRLFFPGCQLGASEPAYVLEGYSRLLEQEPSTGILLQCCGIPAYWAGKADDFEGIIAGIRQTWQDFGCPELVAACPTCMRVLRRHLPEIPLLSIYEALPLPAEQPAFAGRQAAIFDPCASRYEPAMQQRVREAAGAAGLAWQELPHHGAEALCCGWGGHMSLADPDLAWRKRELGAAESPLPYVTYCQVCRDNFLNAGKESLHMLDILLGLDPSHSAPTLSQKQNNHLRLRSRLLQRFWNQPPAEPEPQLPLRFTEAALSNMERDMLLEQDVLSVIQEAEASGRKFSLGERGPYCANAMIGRVTVWAEYEVREGYFLALNVYAHRMKIEY